MAARLRLWPGLCLVVLIGALVWLGFLAQTAASVAHAQVGCAQLLANGGFETEQAWVLGANPVPPRYVTNRKNSGNRSLLLGITDGTNTASYSSARQTVALPAGATRITLSFWYYAIATGAPLTDKFELAILAEDGVTILDSPWESFNDSRNWNQMAVDLTRWSGRTVQIYFNAYNDGLGGVAALYLDDAALDSCPGAGTATATATATPTGTLTPAPTGTVTPTPTQTPWIIVASPTSTSTPVTPVVVTATYTPWVVTATHTPTPTSVTASSTPWIIVVTATYTPSPITGSATPIYVTPVPGQCVDLLHNGGFEEGLDWWEPGKDPIPVRLVSSPVRAGARALFLGTDQVNVSTYSSIRQEVYLDPAYPQLTLEFWTNTGAETVTGTDHQEAVLLEPDPSIIAKVWRVLLNERAWVQRSIGLDEYAGRTVVIYFNVVNDGAGGRTWMYLDDVHLWGCGGAAASSAGVAVSAGAAPVAVAPVPPQAAVPMITVVVTATPTPEDIGAEALPEVPVRGAGPTAIVTTIALPTRTIAPPTLAPLPGADVTVPAVSFRSFLDRVLPFSPLVRVIVVTLVAIGILLLLLRLLTR